MSETLERVLAVLVHGNRPHQTQRGDFATLREAKTWAIARCREHHGGRSVIEADWTCGWDGKFAQFGTNWHYLTIAAKGGGDA